MKLSIENVGILSKIDLEINGITVIAGENDTGKSTISKSLYAMFNGCYRLDEKVINAKIDSIRNNIDNFLEKNFSLHLGKRYIKKDKILEILSKNKKSIDEEAIKNLLLEIIKGTGKRNDLANKLLNTIKNIEQRDLNISIEELKNRINDIKLINNIKIINRLLQENFNREF